MGFTSSTRCTCSPQRHSTPVEDLEEPPAHAIFILATTEIHKIPATVLSRCQWHEFRRIPLKDIVQYLKEQSAAEGISVAEPVYTEIARQATGSLRDAISLLDQLTSTGEEITLERAQQVLGTATSMRVVEIVDALLAKDAGQGLTTINQALDSGTDPRQLARQVVSYLRNVLLFNMGNKNQVDLSTEARAKVAEHAEQFDIPGLLEAIKPLTKQRSRKLPIGTRISFRVGFHNLLGRACTSPSDPTTHHYS